MIPNIPPDGITEFPYFSFLLGDLHPHYMAIPFVLLIVALAASRWLDAETLAGPARALVLAGVALATLIPASTWDVPTFWGLYLAGTRRRRLAPGGQPREAAGPAAGAGAAGGRGGRPGRCRTSSGTSRSRSGWALSRERTPLVSMLILFGPALLVAALLAIWLAWRGRPSAGDDSGRRSGG